MNQVRKYNNFQLTFTTKIIQQLEKKINIINQIFRMRDNISSTLSLDYYLQKMNRLMTNDQKQEILPIIKQKYHQFFQLKLFETKKYTSEILTFSKAQTNKFLSNKKAKYLSLIKGIQNGDHSLIEQMINQVMENSDLQMKYLKYLLKIQSDKENIEKMMNEDFNTMKSNRKDINKACEICFENIMKLEKQKYKYSSTDIMRGKIGEQKTPQDNNEQLFRAYKYILQYWQLDKEEEEEWNKQRPISEVNSKNLQRQIETLMNLMQRQKIYPCSIHQKPKQILYFSKIVKEEELYQKGYPNEPQKLKQFRRLKNQLKAKIKDQINRI